MQRSILCEACKVFEPIFEYQSPMHEKLLLDMLIKLGEGDKAQKCLGTVVLPEFYEYGTGTLF